MDAVCVGLIRVLGEQSAHWRVSNSVGHGYPEPNGTGSHQGSWHAVGRRVCVITAYLCPALGESLMQGTCHPFETEDFEGS